MTYIQAQVYAHELNRKQFAGYNDWRLPTIQELLSLMKLEREQSTDLYIDPIFDAKDKCWSSDEFTDIKYAWLVDFYKVDSVSDYIKTDAHVYVRCVSSGKER